MTATKDVIKAGNKPFKVFTTTLTVATAATTATVTSDDYFCGEIVKVELDPGAAMSTSATLKGYEGTTALATGTRDHFLNYTFPASEVELVFYPLKATVLNDGSTATNPLNYSRHTICGPITIDLASATAADAVTVRVYVKEV